MSGRLANVVPPYSVILLPLQVSGKVSSLCTALCTQEVEPRLPRCVPQLDHLTIDLRPSKLWMATPLMMT